MLKNLTTTILALSLLGILAMKNQGLASIYNPDSREEAFENTLKSINTGHDPVIKNITTMIINGHAVDKMAWSADSRYLAAIVTKNNDATSVIIINQDQNKVVKELPLTEQSYWRQSIAFSPDGHYLAASGLSLIRLWDTKTWAKIRDIEGANEKDPYSPFLSSSLVFSPDSQSLASLFFSSFWWPKGEMRRGKVAKQEAYGKIEQSRLHQAAWQDFDTDVIGHTTDIIVIFKIHSNKKVYWPIPKSTPLNVQFISSNLAYSTDGKHLLAAVNEIKKKDPQDSHGIEFAKLQLHNSQTSEIIKEISIASPQNEIITIRTVKEQLFTGARHQEAIPSYAVMTDTDPIRLWDANFSSSIKEFKDNFKNITSFSVSQNGKILISFYGSLLEIWDVEKNKLLKQMIVNDRYSAECLISPDGKVIAITDMDKDIVRFIRLK